jgi:UDP-glucose 4-epimerase
MTRYLITGGAGFIGSHLVDAIVEHNLGQVTLVDNLNRGSLSNISHHQNNPAVKFVDADIRHIEKIRSCFRGIDIVFHLAAQSNVMGASLDASYSVETNVVGTVNVLQSAYDAGVSRVVFASSREVYGEPSHMPVSESCQLAPKNLYGASKAAGEMYCGAFVSRGLDVRILRFANVYGSRDRERVIPLWLQRAKAGIELEVYGGSQTIDFVWIGAATDALLRASEVSRLPAPVNIASGQGTPILSLARRILELTDSKSTLSIQPARNEEVVGFVADITAMRQRLKLLPPTDPLACLPSLIHS